ncbi:hypothetical protein N665_0044s0026 [Sinapis alba]|nr:hypothetical protein N665_0044s0026 [Sinapis alba]
MKNYIFSPIFPIHKILITFIILNLQHNLLWIILNTKFQQQCFFHLFSASNRHQLIDTIDVPLSFPHNESKSHV